MAMCITHAGSAFLGVKFLPNFLFLGHHFGFRYASKPIKSQKMVRWVGAQSQVTSTKKVRKYASVVTSPQQTSNPIQKNYFKI